MAWPEILIGRHLTVSFNAEIETFMTKKTDQNDQQFSHTVTVGINAIFASVRSCYKKALISWKSKEHLWTTFTFQLKVL